VSRGTVASRAGSPGRSLRAATLAGDLPDAAVGAGLAGELLTAVKLRSLGTGFTVYSSLRVPGRDRGDIDHVVVRTGSSRAIIVDSKCWSNAEYRTRRCGVTQRRFTRRGEPGEWEDFPPGDIDLEHMRSALQCLLGPRVAVSTMLAVWPTIAERSDLMNLSDYRPRGVDRVVAGPSLVRSVVQQLRKDGSLPRGTHEHLRSLIVR
jgi:hypothetical protein